MDIQNWKVTSANRLAARRILSTWHASTDVRTWTIAQLNGHLMRAVNDGLITHAAIARALRDEGQAPEQTTPPEPTGHGDARDGDDGDGEQVEVEVETQSPAQDETPRSEAYEAGKRDAQNGFEKDEGYGDTQTELDDYMQGYEDGESESQENGDESKDEGKDDEQDDTQQDDTQQDDTQQDDTQQDDDETQDDEQKDDEIRHPMFDVVMRYIRADLNVALVGPAGSGKSYLARQVAKMLDRDFYVNGAMMSKYDLIGYNDANGTYHPTPAYEAFVNGGVHCFDELDASVPEAVVAFNGMTDDQPFYTFPCGQKEKHPNYTAIACMNTWGNGATADYVGRFKQDKAAMSRFVAVYLDYDENVERMVAGEHDDILQRVWKLRRAVNALGIRHVVSTRMVKHAVKARAVKVCRSAIDRDILFAGLDEHAIAQVKREMKNV